ncbi:MAG: MarR family transcriptional regulator [Candidatus Gastranaerophilales bacterium]|nr:MarR family transcriptional regulator [Candidatus Gastranaerophilales bacterium]
MRETLSLISKIHQKGNNYIIEQLNLRDAKGLAPSHGDILICLYQDGKMTMKDIAQKIRRTKPTVTVLVDKLEKSGFVKREVSESDSRSFNIVLTKKGEDFRPVFEKISKGLNDMLHKNLTDKEADTLEKLLSKVYRR